MPTHKQARPVTSSGRDEGAAELTIRVAGISVRAHPAQPEVSLHVSEAEGRFLDSSHEPNLNLQVVVGDVARRTDGEALFTAGDSWRLLPEGRLLRLELSRQPNTDRPIRVLCLDPVQGVGNLTVAPQPYPGLVVSPHGFRVNPFQIPLLELLVCWQLAERGGACLHSSAVALGDSGCLFAGVADSGKTTIATLLQDVGGTILSDDRVGVTSEGGGFVIHGTPWHGTPALSEPLCAPLRAIFLIEHGERNEAREIRGAKACAELLAVACPPYFSHELMERTVATCAAITEAVQCYRLRFLPDERVVEVVGDIVAPTG